jgi:phosphate transport system permease protein
VSGRRRLFTPRQAQVVALVVLWAATAVTIAVLVFIIGFVLKRGLPHVSWAFLTEAPRESGREGGIFPLIVGTLQVTALAVLVATPLGLGTAIYLAEYTRGGRLMRIIHFGTESLAGVPSIIFGLFGFVFFVITLGFGWSILSGGLTLAFMILPTVIRTSEEAIKAVPFSYREVALSLGASRWETILKVVLPSAVPGIVTGVILSVGRAMEETAVVIFTAGSSLAHAIPKSIFDGTRTLAVHIYLLAREGISTEKAFATASVLILAIVVINMSAYTIMNRFIRRYR